MSKVSEIIKTVEKVELDQGNSNYACPIIKQGGNKLNVEEFTSVVNS